MTVGLADSSRSVLGVSRQQDSGSDDKSFERIRPSHIHAYDASRKQESNKHHMIANMLKDSILDFDNSRNDVVPQRSQIDDE